LASIVTSKKRPNQKDVKGGGGEGLHQGRFEKKERATGRRTLRETGSNERKGCHGEKSVQILRGMAIGGGGRGRD